jgi:predicted Rossmann fold flavoprotein
MEASVPTETYDVIVLGAGAAGLMCAIEAGKRGRSVAVLESNDRIGRKILISGGGRCNFTNIHCNSDNFLSGNPSFAKSALSRYTPHDFIALVEKHKIAYHEKTLGQLFCDTSAREITDLLERECQAAGVRIFLQTRVQEVSKADGFAVRAGDSEFHAPALVVATGGLSIPKMGATSFGYDLAQQFGLKICETRPALVPLTLSAADCRRYCDLSGLSVAVIAAAGGHPFREKMLITHRGLSGPAILQISSYWKAPQPVTIDLAPDTNLTAPLRLPDAPRNLTAAKAAFRTALPHRLADRWLEHNAPAKWNNPGLDQLERLAHNWQLTPTGTEGYEKAEVTAGGVDTNELSSKTMESRKVPGLFFIGEVVDVTGHLGGFNFQWAWSSGYSAGQAV